MKRFLGKEEVTLHLQEAPARVIAFCEFQASSNRPTVCPYNNSASVLPYNVICT